MFRQDSLDNSERPAKSKRQKRKARRQAGPPAPRRPLNSPPGQPRWPEDFLVRKTGAVTL
jgi:hypothetical protein